ncbi:ketopantoate reductase family protein [Microbulbifer sp. CnH-101-E]|uniref:ketopantoate reductase family protein n=1 Tax=unclassified Microbulbifer TaxID=2619833 RepID=UPI004039A456
MNIIVMGAGALGSYFGGHLARAGHKVLFIARGRQLKALKERGLTVLPLEEEPFTIQVDAAETTTSVGGVDLILFCVKTYDTEAAIKLIARAVGEDTKVLTLQNGVDSLDSLNEAFGRIAILGGISWTNVAIEEPGVVRHRYPGPLVFGDPNVTGSKRTQVLKDTFLQAGVVAEVSDDITRAIWEKFLFICAVNGMTALTRLPVGTLLACHASRELFVDIMCEVYSLARRSGIELSEDTVERTIRHMEKELPPGVLNKTLGSMYFDIASGRRLELESLNGAVVQRGKQLKVATPVNSFVYGALKPWANGEPMRNGV